MYDPAKSETFKALQGDLIGDAPVHEVTPVPSKVFTPVKVHLTIYTIISYY